MSAPGGKRTLAEQRAVPGRKLLDSIANDDDDGDPKQQQPTGVSSPAVQKKDRRWQPEHYRSPRN